jgi:M6 family metalloprotease-like protein
MRYRLTVLTAAVAVAVFLSTGSAWAIGPSPALQNAMRHDAALAARVHAAEAANPDQPNVGLKLLPDARGIPTWQVAAQAAPTGTWNLCVLLARYSDTAESTSAAYFQNLYFGTSGGASTVRGYYRDESFFASGGPRPIDIQSGGQTLFWVTLPNTRIYYDTHTSQMVGDAITAADAAGFNFAPFDNNNDGKVDALQVVHVGRGQEDYPSDANDIWSYASSLSTTTAHDGKTFGAYSVVPEMVHDQWLGSGSSPAYWVPNHLGVMCHELGHNFGLPDMYDYGYDSYGLGDWSIMAGGSWNGPHFTGDYPARLDAWCAASLGFITPTDVTANIPTATIPCADSTATGGVYRIRRAGATSGSEYYLVENRRRRGTDSYIPGNGLLIYHVDETRMTGSPQDPTKWNNDQTHYAAGIKEAHGGLQSLQSYAPTGNAGDLGDPWPGSANNKTFTDTSDPNAHYYDGTATRIRVRNVGQPYDGSLAVTATIEITDMSGSIAINAGSQYASSTAVTVTNSIAGTPLQMAFDSGTGFSAYEAFGPTKALNLGAGEGTRTVTAEFKDVNNVVVTASDTIVVDTIAPTGTFMISGGASVTGTRAVTADSGITGSPTQMRFSVDGGSTWTGWVAYTASYPLTLPSGDGTKTVVAQYVDAAGNSSTYSDTIQLATGGPAAPVISSPTHPDENAWYAASTVTMQWGASLVPTNTGSLALAAPNGVDSNGSTAVVANGIAGLEVIDVGNPAAPVRAAAAVNVPAPGTPVVAYDVVLNGGWAYVSTEKSGLVRVNVSDPHNPVVTLSDVLSGGASSPAATRIARSGSEVYLACGSGGVRVVDASTSPPHLDTTLADAAGATDVAVSNGYLWVACGMGGLRAYSLGTPAAPSFQGSYTSGHDIRSVAFNGWMAYCGDAGGGMLVINVASPSAMSLVRTVPTRALPNRVEMQGTYLYSAEGTGGVEVFDGGVAWLPYVVGTDAGGDVGSLAVSGDHVYADDRSTGLRVKTATVPTALTYAYSFSSVTATDAVGSTWTSGSIDSSNHSVGATYVNVQAKDQFGRLSPVAHRRAQVDNVVPWVSVQLAGGAARTTTRTIQLVADVVDGGGPVTTMQYSLDASATWTGWSSYVATQMVVLPVGDGNKTVVVHVRDAAGNQGAGTAQIVLDEHAPIIVAAGVDHGAAVTNNVHATLDSTVTNAVNMRISTDGGATWSGWQAYVPSLPFDLPLGADGVRGVYVDFSSAMGTVTNWYLQIYYDTAPPTSFASLSIGSPNGTNGWYVTAPAVTLTKNDSGGAIRYKWSAGASWTAYAVPVTAPEGVSRLYFSSVDDAGNVEATRTLDFSVDTAAPVNPTLTSITHTIGATSTAGTFKATFTGATDAASGVNGYSYVFSHSATSTGGMLANLPSSVTTLTADLTSGTWYLHVRTVDAAGNWSGTVHSGPYIVAMPAPAGTFTIDANAGYTNNRTLSIVSAVSSATEMRFSTDAGATWSTGPYADTTSVVVPAGDGWKAVTGQYRNGQDGWALSVTKGIALDTVPATVTLTPVPALDGENGWWVSPLTVVCSASESGVTMGHVDSAADVTITTNVPIPEGVHTLRAHAVDLAGNVGTETVGTYKVDVQDPGVTTVTSTNPSPNVTSTSSFVTARLQASDPGAGSGVSSFRYAWAKDTTAAPSGTLPASGSGVATITSPVLSAGRWYLSVQAKDAAGRIGPLAWAGPFVISTAQVARVSGGDRYETAVAIAKAHFVQSDNVVIATGQDFPDALSASGLCGVLRAPLLLTRKDSVPDTVTAAIASLGVKHVWIVGGDTVVSASVQSQLDNLAGVDATRVAGGNRYDTARKIALVVKANGGGSDGAFLANGRGFPDALACSPLAYARRMPILLTEATTLPPDTKAAITALAPSQLLVAGSGSVVDTSVATAAGATWHRLAGADRYATASAVAGFGLSQHWVSPGFLGVAFGSNFPDALGGGVASGGAGGVLLLTPSLSTSAPLAQYLADHKPEIGRVEVFGGPTVVDGSVLADIAARLH